MRQLINIVFIVCVIGALACLALGQLLLAAIAGVLVIASMLAAFITMQRDGRLGTEIDTARGDEA